MEISKKDLALRNKMSRKEWVDYMTAKTIKQERATQNRAVMQGKPFKSSLPVVKRKRKKGLFDIDFGL